MNGCIKNLCDYDLIKKCRVCKNFLLKSNFHKTKNMRDVFNPQKNSVHKNFFG